MNKTGVNEDLLNSLVSSIQSHLELNNQQLVYLCLAGSRAYGRNTSESDLDLRGIYLPSPESFLLEQKANTLELPEEDIVLQPLAKFFALAKAGNPNILEWLFVKDEHVFYADRYGKMIRENRELFLSQQMLKSYLGFAHGSWKDLTRMLVKDVFPDPLRRHKIAKHASHIERLLRQLLSALQTGSFSTWAPEQIEPFEKELDENGHLILRPEYLNALRELDEQIGEAKQTTRLPKQADETALNKLQMAIARHYLLASFQKHSDSAA